MAAFSKILACLALALATATLPAGAQTRPGPECSKQGIEQGAGHGLRDVRLPVPLLPPVR
jgi:hypothetical protein